MPFYEYQCKNCGHELEAMQKVSDAPLKKCPDCGKSQLQRLMSAPVFRLKGGGWYETDFKGAGDNKRNLVDKPEADAAKDKDSKSTDSKAEPTTDVKADSATGDLAKPEKNARDASKKMRDKSGKSDKKVNLKPAQRAGKKPASKPKKKSR